MRYILYALGYIGIIIILVMIMFGGKIKFRVGKGTDYYISIEIRLINRFR
jgi:hypothetical protein